jgi:hypothetical protein
MPYIYGSGQGYFYACVFQGLGATHLFRIYQTASIRIYECEFDNMYLWMQAGGEADIYRTNYRKGTYGLLLYNSIAGNYDDIFIHDATDYPIYFVYISTGGELTNLRTRRLNYETFRCHALTANINLTNADLSAWTFYWTGACTGKVFRKYTFDLIVTYPNGTAFANANVLISNAVEGLIYNGTTDAYGHIPQQTLTMGFYNQTGGNTIYSYNAFWLNATSADGQYIYYKSWTMENLANWEIALLPTTTTTTPVNTANYMLIGSMLSMPIMLAIALHQRKKANAPKTK